MCVLHYDFCLSAMESAYNFTIFIPISVLSIGEKKGWVEVGGLCIHNVDNLALNFMAQTLDISTHQYRKDWTTSYRWNTC
jgi:hypothetical protein